MDILIDSGPVESNDKLGRLIQTTHIPSQDLPQIPSIDITRDKEIDDEEELAMLRAIGVQATDLQKLMNRTSVQAEINARNKLEQQLLQRAYELEKQLGIHRQSDRIKEAMLLIDKPFIDVSILRDDSHPEHLFGVEAWTGWLEARAFIAGQRIEDMTCQSIAEIHKILVPGRADIIGGHIRSKRVLGSANGEELELDSEQHTAIDSNPLLVFKKITATSNKGYIVYPTVDDPDSFEKCIAFLGPEYSSKLTSSPNTAELITLLLEKVLAEFKQEMKALIDKMKEYRDYTFKPVSKYDYNDDVDDFNERMLYEEVCRLAAKFQRQIVSIHPFADANGRLSRLLLYSLFNNLGSHPPIISEWDQDLFFNEDQWVNKLMDGHREYTSITNSIKGDYERVFENCSTQELCVDDQERIFFDNYYSKIYPPPPAGKRMVHEEYRRYLNHYRSSLYNFLRDTTNYIYIDKTSKPPFIRPDQYPYWEAYDTSYHGGVVSEKYISLFGDTRPEIQAFIREQYYNKNAPHLYRGCPINSYELMDDPHEILAVFEVPVGLGASYRASLISGDKQNSIQELPKAVAQDVLKTFNSMMLDNFAKQNNLTGTQVGFDIEKEWSSFISQYLDENNKSKFLKDTHNGATYLGWLAGMHQLGKTIEARLSPMISLSTNDYVAFDWTKKNVVTMNGGAVIETLMPKSGIVYSPEANDLLVIHEGWAHVRGSEVNIIEGEVMVAGGIDPNAVETITLFLNNSIFVLYRTADNHVIYASSASKQQEIYAFNSQGKLELQKKEPVNIESSTRIDWGINMMDRANTSSYNHNNIPSYYD